MFYAKKEGILSLLAAVKYVNNQTVVNNYLTSPRPCHNFAFMLEGRGILKSEGKQITVQAGDFLVIPKGCTYQSTWIAEPRAVFHSIHFNFWPNCDPFSQKTLPVQAFRLEDFEGAYALVKILHENQYHKDERSFAALSAFYQLCAQVLPKLSFQQNSSTAQLLPALEYMENNYTAQIDVKTLAELCFLSPSRFFAVFKKQTGVSPIVYKNRLCIQKAAQTLLSCPEMSVEDVASSCGFESVIYFRRAFKKMLGKTPTQYKKEDLLL